MKKTITDRTIDADVLTDTGGDEPVLGGGRGEDLAAAAMDYRTFLLEFAKAEKSEDELLELLDAADVKLNVAFEKAERQ